MFDWILIFHSVILKRVVALFTLLAKRIKQPSRQVLPEQSEAEPVTMEMVIKAKKGLGIIEWLSISDSIRALAINRGVEAKPSDSKQVVFSPERNYIFTGDEAAILEIRFSLRENFNLNSETLEPVEM